MSAPSIAPGGPQVHVSGPLKGLPISDPWDEISPREHEKSYPRPVLRGYVPPFASDDKGKVESCIHWMSFTVPYAKHRMWELERMLGGGLALPRAAMGYSDGLVVLGTGRIFWAPARKDMGIHCIIPGEAIKLMPLGEDELIAVVQSMGGHFTRVDVAVDVPGKHVERFREALRSGEVATRAQSWEDHGKYRLGSGQKVADGLSVGSRTGDRHLRVYDKQLEQARRGNEIESLTRFEVEFHDEQADSVAELVRQGERFESMLGAVVDVRERGGRGSHKDRWPRAQWWADIMGQVDEVVIHGRHGGWLSVQGIREWIKHQVAPGLALVVAASGGDIGELLEIVSLGQKRWSGRHRALAAAIGVGA